MHGAVGTGPKKSMPTENWAVLRECINKDFVNSGSIGLIQGKHARYVIIMFPFATESIATYLMKFSIGYNNG